MVGHGVLQLHERDPAAVGCVVVVRSWAGVAEGALARARAPGHLPASLGRTNAHHTPYWAVVVFLGAASACVLAAQGQEQELVLF